MVTSADLTSFSVQAVFQMMGLRKGVRILCEGMDDDVCFGLTARQDTSIGAFIQQHAVPYNYVIRDGDPIRLIRRAINADLVIDGTVYQRDCVPLVEGGPAFKMVRTDIMSMPRGCELQYIDPDKNFDAVTQPYRHFGAPATAGILSVSIAFCISSAQAYQMAYDVVWRAWAQQNNFSFALRDLRYEPGDVLLLVANSGRSHIVEITQSTVLADARINVLQARGLLSSKGVTISSGGRVALVDTSDSDALPAHMFAGWGG